MLMLIYFVRNCQNSWNSCQLTASYVSTSALFRLFLIIHICDI